MTAQDVAPRLFDHHPVDGQDMKSDLDQNVLEGEQLVSRRSSLSQTDVVEASVTCMAKSVVRHPTWTSTAAVQSAESILTCLMLLGVIQPPPSSSSPSSSPGSFSLSSSSDWSSGCCDVSNLVSEDEMTSASCEQVNKHHQIITTTNQRSDTARSLCCQPIRAQDGTKTGS